MELSRRYVVSKEVDTQNVFEEDAVSFLAPTLVQAFAQAKANEEIVFSYLSKNPSFIIRNDRLTVASAWIEDDNLHLEFRKLYAKVVGDTDKRGNERRATNRSRGLRVSLELGEFQTMDLKRTDTLVVDLKAMQNAPLETTVATTTEPEPKKKKQKRSWFRKKKSEPVQVSKASVSANNSIKTRLKPLEELKTDGLITQQEYDAKRKQILNQL